MVWIVPPLGWAMFGWWWSAVTTLISLAIWVAVYWAQRAPLWYALLYPFGAGVVAWIMMRSAWRGSNKVQWRGGVLTPPAGKNGGGTPPPRRAVRHLSLPHRPALRPPNGRGDVCGGRPPPRHTA